MIVFYLTCLWSLEQILVYETEVRRVLNNVKVQLLQKHWFAYFREHVLFQTEIVLEIYVWYKVVFNNYIIETVT